MESYIIKECNHKQQRALYCLRNKRGQLILESYCEHCIPQGLRQQAEQPDKPQSRQPQYNVRIISELEFNVLAGRWKLE